MGTIWVKEFTGGLDVRRLAESSPGGTLIRGRDCHITRGGEVEQRADFVAAYALPAGLTKGLARTPSGLTVFGHQTAPAGLPAGVSYQQLQHPSGEALARVPFATLFDSNIQAIGEFADGSRYVFYDGARVTDVNAPPTAAGSGSPNALLTYVEKMFIASGPNTFFSAIGDSTDYGGGAGIGDGVVVMSTHAEGAEALTGLAPYGEYVAIFSDEVTMIFYFDPDPALTRKVQTLNNTGAIAPRSVTQFGDGDLFYLDRSGIRSLRARDSSNSAATTDIGSPIDDLILEAVETLGDAVAGRAVGVIEPRDGRFWLALGDTIYVFSFFSASKVSAWTEYKPGFTVSDMVVYDRKVWLRSGDTIYVYGGTGAQPQYSDAVQAEAWLPYLDAGAPYNAKHVRGIDAAIRGTWEVRLAMDPNDLGASDLIGRIDKTTFPLQRVAAEGVSTHLGLRFKSLAPESATAPAVLSTAVLHFDRDREEDS